MKVGVIGCGLIGASVARELALRGVKVVIYEMNEPGSGTSGTTFAWVNSHDKEPRAYHDLNVAGIEAHVELQAASRGHGPQWFFQTGNLVWGGTFEDRRERLAEWGYPMEELSIAEAQALEPAVRFDGAESVWLFPSEGYVLPGVLLRRLLDEALELGAELRTGMRVEVTDLLRELDVVVCCAGRWSAEALAHAGYKLPMVEPAAGSAAVGFLAYTAPATAPLGRVLSSPRLNVRPDGGGRLVLQALDLDGHADPAAPVPAEIAEEFEDRATELFGESIRVDAIRVGQRSLPADGLSVVGSVDEDGRLHAVATHSGVTLGPLLGRLAGHEVVEESRPAELEPFLPARIVEERVEGIEPS